MSPIRRWPHRRVTWCAAAIALGSSACVDDFTGSQIELLLEASVHVPGAVTNDIAPPAEELTLDMEWIASRSRARAAAATPLVDRRWTAFRIREKASDDPGLHGRRAAGARGFSRDEALCGSCSGW